MVVVRHVVRAAVRVQPVKPAVWLGVRAGCAVALPLLAAPWLGTLVAVWATLGGFGAVLVDKGGAYHTRATAMATLAIGGSLAVAIGNASAGNLALMSIAMALGCTVCALAASWGVAAVAVGNSIAVDLIVALAVPADPARPWLPPLAFAGGALWALVLATLLWPVRVYRPARRAAANCLGAVAAHARELARRDDLGTPAWRAAITGRHRAIREALEAARGVLAATRRGRRGETGRGDRLLIIVQAADQVFGAMIALEDVLDGLGAEVRARACTEAGPALDGIADALDQLARRVMIEGELPPSRLPDWDARAVAARSITDRHDALARAELGQLIAVIARLHRDVAAISAVIDSLAADGEPVDDSHVIARVEAEKVPRLEPLRSVLAWDSAMLRHALRVGVVAAASVGVTRWLGLSRGYWATLSAVLLLQPYLPATLTRGLQRVAGTIAGGVIAAAIAALIHDPLGLAIVVVVLAIASGAALQLNYALYALFMTPTFVLLAEVHAPDAHLVGVRILDTLVGAGLAVAGALLLWPSREGARIAERQADALSATAAYAGAVFAATLAGVPSPAASVIAARRRVGLALNNAELSLERVVAEGLAGEALAARMTILSTTRRLVAALGALGVARTVVDIAPHVADLAAIGAATQARIEALAAALRAHTAPACVAVPVIQLADPLLATRLARIDLLLDLIGGTVSTCATSDAAARDPRVPRLGSGR